MKVAKMMKLIGTHSGTFHCDEALACYMLKLLPEYKDAEILRSRNTDELAKCDIVVDVGAVCDPETKRFDHHQREFDHSMKSVSGLNFTTKLSSAGLVYAHFGKDILKVLSGSGDDEKINLVYRKVYEKFIEEIDGIDNGVNAIDGTPRYQINTTVSRRVGFLNPWWNDKDQNTDERFQGAMKLVGEEFLDRVNYYFKCWLPARDLIQEAINDRAKLDKSQAIVSFENAPGVPWKEHLYDLEEGLEPRLIYVIYPDSSNGDWRVQCIPEGPTRPFDSRKPLPEHWRGLRGEKLDAETGISGGVFCHATGFIGGNKTKEGALEMARKALHEK